ncbi:hypothetical protein B566_EDAN016400, partial [Ephemera danica]
MMKKNRQQAAESTVHQQQQNTPSSLYHTSKHHTTRACRSLDLLYFIYNDHLRMSNAGEESDGDRSSSPTLFEDSQNTSVEVLNKSRNDSKETNVSTEVNRTSNITDDSPSQDFLAPRPLHDLFGSQQSYMSTSSPLRYPQQ